MSLHPRVSEIRKDLVELAGNAKRFRILSEKYGPKPDAFRRYERDHLTPSVSKTIAKHAELIEETKDMDVMASLGRVAQRMELYFEAADRWLRDPDDPTRYSLSPRETEVLVIWEREVEGDNGTKTIRRKELLTDILKRCGEKGGPTTEEIRVVEINAGILSVEQVINLCDLAGQTEGVGEWRPSSPKSATGVYGRWSVARD